MYTLKEIARLRKEIEALNLEGAKSLKKYKNKDLQKICNGIGPEAFPFGIRECLTKIHPALELCAFIHDVEYSESDGTLAHFTAANDRYAANSVIVAKARYAWYDPRRYIVMLQGRRHARLCQTFGFGGYKVCAK